MHGTRMMTPSEIKDVYGRELVDLHKSRWHFLNTLFSVSEAVMYAQASNQARCSWFNHEACSIVPADGTGCSPRAAC